jgi:hypothetical protein
MNALPHVGILGRPDRNETVAAGLYEIRVKGRLSASVQSAFHGMTACVEPVETVLSGKLEDQAALYGVLQHVQALGLELVEVRRVADSDRTDTTRADTS